MQGLRKKVSLGVILAALALGRFYCAPSDLSAETAGESWKEGDLALSWCAGPEAGLIGGLGFAGTTLIVFGAAR